MKCLFGFFAFLSCTVSYSQYWVEGAVYDAITSDPVPYAHVILADSSTGTFSDFEGKFQLRIPQNVSKLIISHVGYSREEFQLDGNFNLNIRIIPLSNKLRDVAVESQVDKKWERAFRIFQRELFGYNELSSSCKILNPWVIDFAKEGRTFSATSDELIEITNEALGYFVRFRLDKFEKTGPNITLSWKPVDIRDLSSDKETQKTFEEVRLQAYTGSIFHFFKALFEDELLRNGFKAYLIGEDYYDIRGSRNELMQEVIINSLAEITSDTDSLLIDFSGYLQVVYRDSKTGQVESSWLRCKEPAYLDENGILYNASPFYLLGTFSNERLSHYPSLYEIKAYAIQGESQE